MHNKEGNISTIFRPGYLGLAIFIKFDKCEFISCIIYMGQIGVYRFRVR